MLVIVIRVALQVCTAADFLCCGTSIFISLNAPCVLSASEKGTGAVLSQSTVHG